MKSRNVLISQIADKHQPAIRAKLAEQNKRVQIDGEASSASGKYGAKRITIDGIKFASLAESRRFSELKHLQAGGVISDLRAHPHFELVIDGKPVLTRSLGYPNGRRAVYTADSTYTENGQTVVEEHKGRDDEASRLRRAVAETIYGFRIRMTGKASYQNKKRRKS